MKGISGNDFKVLLAEDDEVSIQYLNIFFSRNGAQVEVVQRGDWLLDTLTKGQFGLLVLDLQLHPLNALELVRNIRKELKMNIPIIGLSTVDFNGRALGSGVDTVVRKPFESKDLHRALYQDLQLKAEQV